MQNACNTRTTKRCINLDRKRFTREVVDDVKSSNASAVLQGVMNEVERPPFINPCNHRRGLAAAESNAALKPLAYLKLRRCVKPVDAFVIGDNSLAPQEYAKSPISKAPALHRNVV